MTPPLPKAVGTTDAQHLAAWGKSPANCILSSGLPLPPSIIDS